MEKSTQDRVRAELVAEYEKYAFEALAMYAYHGQRMKPVEENMDHLEKNLKQIETNIGTAELAPDHHTKENRQRVKAMWKDVEDYKKRIESTQKVGAKIQEEVGQWRQKGVTALEQIAHLQVFTLRTPEQIEAEKKAEAAKVEPSPVPDSDKVTTPA